MGGVSGEVGGECFGGMDSRHRRICDAKFTNEVQHLVKVLSWEELIDMSVSSRGVRLPDYMPRDYRSAKSQQVWIARHQQWLGS